MAGCDTLLMVGSSFPYSEFLPKEGQARGVQIDIDGRKLSLRYLPPHLSGKQARHYVEALLRGDPQAREVVVASFREVWDSLTKGRAS
jgi:pyruvate dehydrogenase (quinone)